MRKDDLSNVIKALKNGDIIVYPTDTLYALGADIYNEDAVRKVFNAKKRPYDCPLSVGVASYNEITKIAFTNDIVKKISEHFLPGQLTIILRKKDVISNIITSGLDKIAIRIPKNDIALDLLSRFGPLTITSANIHDKKTPHVIKDIKMQFSKEVSAYLDYGRLDAKASTIVDLTLEEPKVVRKGAITKEEIMGVI